MTETLKLTIDSIITYVDFSFSTLLPDKKQIRWLPILQCGRDKYLLGLLEDGDWAVEVTNGIHRLNKPDSFVSVIVLLEQPINFVYDYLTEFFGAISIKASAYDIFPFESIVRAGFEQKSEYWAELAFSWYKELPKENKLSLINSVSKIIHSKWASQKLRQKAKIEVNRMEFGK